ncbi:S-adenosyl-L-methionine-dependent methyltransferase [Xylaria palmicola]|nr:S-adenosyl-L-methionine-dependent methyltransferase [Xylaria palmicola]
MSTNNYLLPRPGMPGERIRLDIQHELSLLAHDGSLLLSSFPPPKDLDGGGAASPLRVADIGTGTGIGPSNWRGMDGLGAGSFDLIHGRQVLMNLRDPDAALQQVWLNLRPGGMIEIHESWNPLVSEWETDSGEVSVAAEERGVDPRPVPMIVEWHRKTVEGSARMGCDLGLAARLPQALENAGFVDVEIFDRKIPLGGWAIDGGTQDGHERKMDELLCSMLKVAVPSMTTAFCVQGLGWSDERAVAYAARVVKEFERENLGMDRIYARSRNVRGRKPLTPQT